MLLALSHITHIPVSYLPLIVGLQQDSGVAFGDLRVRPERLTRTELRNDRGQAHRWDPGQWVCSDGRDKTAKDEPLTDFFYLIFSK